MRSMPVRPDAHGAAFRRIGDDLAFGETAVLLFCCLGDLLVLVSGDFWHGEWPVRTSIQNNLDAPYSLLVPLCLLTVPEYCTASRGFPLWLQEYESGLQGIVPKPV